jgi:hypothetical protein
MTSVPHDDNEALALFTRLVMSVEDVTETERVATALLLGLYYGAGKLSAVQSGIPADQSTITCAAYSYALDSVKDVFTRVENRQKEKGKQL